MFHGTSAEKALSIRKSGFRPSADGMLGYGVYVTRDINKAKAYGSTIIKAEVAVGRVKKIDYQGHPMQKSWHQHYDTAWVPAKCGMVPSGMTENCVYDPKRIRILEIQHAG